MPSRKKEQPDPDDTIRRLDVAIKGVQLEIAKEQLEELRQSRWKKPVAAVLMASLGLLVSVAATIILPSLSSQPAARLNTVSRS